MLIRVLQWKKYGIIEQAVKLAVFAAGFDSPEDRTEIHRTVLRLYHFRKAVCRKMVQN